MAMMSQYRIIPAPLSPPSPPPPITQDEKISPDDKRSAQSLAWDSAKGATTWIVWVTIVLCVLGSICTYAYTLLAKLLTQGRLPESTLGEFLCGLPLTLVLVVMAALMIGALLYGLVAIVVAMLTYPQKLREVGQSKLALKAAQAEAEASRRVAEADTLTSQLITVLQSSSDLAVRLPQELSEASNRVRRAEREYSDNAFAPFWDEVEVAMHHLDSFNRGVQQLSQNAQRYYDGLKGRNHTFPSFPAYPASLPDPRPVYNELQRIIRMAQRNFQFALIWEQRKTREVLFMGFRTMEQAIDNLAMTTQSSIFDLQSSVSSDMARLVEEEIKTRETLAEEQIRTRETLAEEQIKTRETIEKYRRKQ